MADAGYHRTYPPLTITKGGETSYFPAGHFEAREKVFTKAGARRAWLLNARKELEPVVIRVLKDQNFAKHATDFELAFSKLAALHNRADPLIAEDGTVVGHFGWFQGGHHILIPKGWDANGRAISFPDINDSVALGVSIFVASRNSMSDYYGFHGVTDESFRLVTTLDGLVIGQLGYKTRDGAESVWYSPLDFIAIGKMLVSLGYAGSRIAVSALSRRGSIRLFGFGPSKDLAAASLAAVTAASTRRAGRITADEMERYLIGIMKEHRELARLYGVTVRNLSGEPLQREVLTILREWEHAYGRAVQFVEKGVVQKASGRTGNFVSLQGNTLMIEKQVLDDPKGFFKEVVHELSANALRVRGGNITERELAFVGREFTKLNNALFILENSIMRVGGLKEVLRLFR